jgi:hypothetical protein
VGEPGQKTAAPVSLQVPSVRSAVPAPPWDALAATTRSELIQVLAAMVSRYLTARGEEERDERAGTP